MISFPTRRTSTVKASDFLLWTAIVASWLFAGGCSTQRQATAELDAAKYRLAVADAPIPPNPAPPGWSIEQIEAVERRLEYLRSHPAQKAAIIRAISEKKHQKLARWMSHARGVVDEMRTMDDARFNENREQLADDLLDVPHMPGDSERRTLMLPHYRNALARLRSHPEETERILQQLYANHSRKLDDQLTKIKWVADSAIHLKADEFLVNKSGLARTWLNLGVQARPPAREPLETR